MPIAYLIHTSGMVDSSTNKYIENIILLQSDEIQLIHADKLKNTVNIITRIL